MANDSTTAGYLQPVDSAPTEDSALDDFLHDWVQGVSGFTDPTLIRPRWQPEPPIQPAFATNWIAFGVTNSKTDFDAYEAHDPTVGTGVDTLMLTEELELLLSFYGPSAVANALLFRAACRIRQNRDALVAASIGLIDASDVTILPTLMKERWVRRADLSVRLRRNDTRVFQIRTIVEADATVNNERYVTPVIAP